MTTPVLRWIALAGFSLLLPLVSESHAAPILQRQVSTEEFAKGWKEGWVQGWLAVKGGFAPFPPFPPFAPPGHDNYETGYNMGMVAGERAAEKSG
jgi:hypothetical protein